jgi:hypothetical protein
MSVEADLAFYNQIKPDLLEKRLEGTFVLIKDGALVDVYPTYKEAYNAAVTQFGTAQIFIKQVEAQDTVERA